MGLSTGAPNPDVKGSHWLPFTRKETVRSCLGLRGYRFLRGAETEAIKCLNAAVFVANVPSGWYPYYIIFWDNVGTAAENKTAWVQFAGV
jgi:hypothetical protein